MQFTPQQEQAIQIHDRHLIVTAGAGSGKTRVLVERFLHLLRQNPTWKLTDIVAITFTDKAAREMRDRIRSAIDEQLSETSDGTTLAIWRRHQASLDAARISTIHGLCAQLLRANPVEAQLDPHFVVLDEVQARLRMNEAVQAALVQFLQSYPTQTETLLKHYQLRQIRLTLRDLISRSTVHQLEEALAHHTMPTTVYEHWQAQRYVINQNVLDRVREDDGLREACAWIDIFNFGAIREDKLWSSWAVVLELREHLFDTDIDPDEALDILTQLSSTKRINLTGGAQKYWGTKETVQESKGYLRKIRETAVAYVAQMIAPLNPLDEESATLTLAWRDLILHTAGVYNHLKNEQNALDFDDLEYLTVRLLEDHPTVAARYADSVEGDFKHLMVDEFQDTNDMQRRIVYKLAGMGQPNTAGRLFVVGDPKQSIYAFRGADVRVFGDVQADIVKQHGQVVALSQSFRTHQRLVENFNALFTAILPPPNGPVAEYMVNYEAMSAFRAAEAVHDPAIYLKIFQKAKQTTGDVDTREWEAEYITQLIQQWVDNKPVWQRGGGLRPMRYGDIALLFQSLNNATVFEAAFQAAGIPFITIAGRGYFERQEVWDMLNLLAALYRPSDDLALASVLRSPMIGLSDDALLLLRLRMREKRPLPLWQALMTIAPDPAWPVIDDVSDLAAVGFAQEVLSHLQQLTGRLTIAELISAALDVTGFEATLLAMQDGELRRANVLKLLSVARQQQHVSLSQFTQFIQNMTAFEAREGDAVIETSDAVQLMTVHKSKGLEFPVVMLPRCDWSRGGGDSAVVMLDRNVGPVAAVKLDTPIGDEDTDEVPASEQRPSVYKMVRAFSQWREQAERRRLLYVAMTRAQDYLVISSSKMPSEKSWTWIGELLRALVDEDSYKEIIGVKDTFADRVPCATGYIDLEVMVLDKPFKRDRRDRQAAHSAQSGTERYDTFPLLNKPEIFIPGNRLHVSATDLEFFGRVRQLNSPTATGEFKLRLLRDLPLPIRPVMAQRQRSTETIIGNVVHRALQMQAVLSDTLALPDLRELLSGFAWEEGAIDHGQQKRVVDDAVDLLRKYAISELARAVAASSQVFRELEFVFEHKRYVIHGMIDLLFERNGKWYIVDYKTSRIPDIHTPSTFSERYHYQMGAYAAAVEAQLGLHQTPIVMIYYLRRSELYVMPEADWRGAMQTLDQDLEATLNTQ